MAVTRASASSHSRASDATHVRSSLLLSSVQSLRARDHFGRYVAQLDPALRESIVQATPGVWLPMNVALAHYQACEALDLPLEEEITLGGAVGDRVQGSFIGFLLRGATQLGATPWIALSQVDRIWERVFKGGGGAAVEKTAAKDATCRFTGLSIVDVPYLRNAWRGAFIAGMQPFCRKAYAVEVPEQRRPGSALYKLSWA